MYPLGGFLSYRKVGGFSYKTKNEILFKYLITLNILRKMGLEPTRAYTHKILSLACLPIPALPQVEYQIPTICNISNTQKKVNRFFKFSEKVLFESNKTDTDVSFRSEKVL